MTSEASDALGAVRGTAYDSDGSEVGAVDEIYTDKETGEPSFVTVHTGLFGSKTTFVPLADASVEGNDLRLPYDKAKIKDAPGVEPDADITDEEQDRLYDYYGVGGHSGTGGYDATDAGTVTGGGASIPVTDDAMTRSGERLEMGTRREEIRRARLRKYVTASRRANDADGASAPSEESSPRGERRHGKTAAASIPLTTTAQVRRLADMRARAQAKLDAVRSRSA